MIRFGFSMMSLSIMLLILAGCSGSEKPESLPSQTLTQQAAEPPPPPPPPPRPSAEAEDKKKEKDSSVVVIDPGGKNPRGKTTLAAASKAERDRRESTPKSRIKIDDKNLQEWASQGTVTIADTRKNSEEESLSAGYSEDKENFWRDEVLRRRTEWSDLVDEILELEEKVSELRTRFYSEDDPVRRDTQIKPEWDTSQERLSKARREAARAEADLEAFLEKGRRAGALPGWLREGIDLEPEERPYEKEKPQEREYGEPIVSDGIISEPTITEEDR